MMQFVHTADDGHSEVHVYQVASSLCTDRGRAINSWAGDQPVGGRSTRGRAINSWAGDQQFRGRLAEKPDRSSRTRVSILAPGPAAIRLWFGRHRYSIVLTAFPVTSGFSVPGEPGEKHSTRLTGRSRSQA